MIIRTEIRKREKEVKKGREKRQKKSDDLLKMNKQKLSLFQNNDIIKIFPQSRFPLSKSDFSIRFIGKIN